MVASLKQFPARAHLTLLVNLVSLYIPMHIRSCSFAVLGLMASLSAQALVYSNGPFQTDATGGGPLGTSPMSILQTLAPVAGTTFGFGAQQAATATVRNALTDQFTVNTLMAIDQIEVFGYATGATVPSMTGLYLQIWSSDPSLPGAVSMFPPGYGGFATANNIVTTNPGSVSNTFTGIYRLVDTVVPTTATTRNVQSCKATLPATLLLTPGTYWLEFAFNGINFVPPLTTKNVLVTGDGKQFLNTTSAYAAVANGAVTSFCGFPFNFYSNTPVATPGSITNLGGGCSAMGLEVRGAAAVGGHLRAELINVNPLMFGVVVIGQSDPGLPLGILGFGCGCTLHAALDFLNVGNSFELQIPVNASLAGVQLNVQGLQLDLIPVGGAACAGSGLLFDLTDGFRFTLNNN